MLEALVDNTRIITNSKYFDINRLINTDMSKIETKIAQAKGPGVTFAMDSKCRSTGGHDIQTDRRGKMLEEVLMSKLLHIMNEESCLTTIHNSRGTSNIDLTVFNNQVHYRDKRPGEPL